MAKKKKRSTSKKQSTKKTVNQEKKDESSKKASARKKFVAFFVGILGLGVATFFTPLYDVIDNASGGMLTNMLGEEFPSDVNNINNNNTTYDVNDDDFNIDQKSGLPAFEVDDKTVVHHKYYSLRYNEQHEQAEWVAYLLRSKYVHGNHDRNDHFRSDPDVPSESATATDYRGSGYDRGHLAPAADFSFSKEAMDESFYMSNMSPQSPQFNRGIWKGLETKVRQWADEKKKIYVVSGPILKPRLRKLGDKNRISIPKEFYKIVFDPNPKHPHMIAFLMPNKKCNGFYEDFMVPVDQIESLTGIDFFHQLPDKLEDYLEKMTLTDSWFEGKEAVPAPFGDMSVLE